MFRESTIKIINYKKGRNTVFLCHEIESRWNMSTFKMSKNKNYTIISNYYLRNRNLLLKVKVLLSFMLSLLDDWNYLLKGLIAICKENNDAICSTLN